MRTTGDLPAQPNNSCSSIVSNLLSNFFAAILLMQKTITIPSNGPLEIHPQPKSPWRGSPADGV